MGREVAWVYTEAAYHPRYVRRVLGVTNAMADALSRLTDNSKTYAAPALLANVAPTQVPIRSRSWYKTLAATQVG